MTTGAGPAEVTTARVVDSLRPEQAFPPCPQHPSKCSCVAEVSPDLSRSPCTIPVFSIFSRVSDSFLENAAPAVMELIVHTGSPPVFLFHPRFSWKLPANFRWCCGILLRLWGRLHPCCVRVTFHGKYAKRSAKLPGNQV